MGIIDNALSWLTKDDEGGDKFHSAHIEVEWAIIGDIKFYSHATISSSIQVQYDDQTVFGSHGQYSIWTGTMPRTYSFSTTLIASNAKEAKFHMDQIEKIYFWTQENPPLCKVMKTPLVRSRVKIESFSVNVDEGTLLTTAIGTGDTDRLPMQIGLTMELKECKPI